MSFVREPSAGVVNVTPGAVVSMVNVFAELVPVLPAATSCVACAVYVPSGSAVASIVYAPVVPLRVAGCVCSSAPSVDEPV